jgi:predicted nicotinamide N-methyase
MPERKYSSDFEALKDCRESASGNFIALRKYPMDTLGRREFVALAGASGLNLWSPNAFAQSGEVFLNNRAGSIPTNKIPLADCFGVGQAIDKINDEIARIQSMNNNELFKMLEKVENSLDASKATHKAAMDATNEALSANNAQIKKKAIFAVRKSNDLILASSVQFGNPQLVGAAAGMHVLVGASVFAVQAIEAKNDKDVASAVVTLTQDRWAMATILTNNKKNLANKQKDLGKAIFETGVEIAILVNDASALKSKLADQKHALLKIEKNKVNLPKNGPKTRAYFVAMLEANRFVFDILHTAYGNKNCQTPDLKPGLP